MRKIHLAYMGGKGSEIAVYAGYVEKYFPKVGVPETTSRDLVSSDKTPRQLLNILKEQIFRETKERPDTCDIWEVQDSNPEFNNMPRHFGFEIRIGFTKSETLSAKKGNRERHDKLYPVYRSFVEELQRRDAR